MRWRYYCDHCKKAGGSAGHLAKHERGCTNNPERVCGVCHRSGNGPSKPVVELVAALGIGDAAGMAALRSVCDNCPACILAAIRQSKTLDHTPMEMSELPLAVSPGWYEFDFKAELAAFWQEINEERANAEVERERHWG